MAQSYQIKRIYQIKRTPQALAVEVEGYIDLVRETARWMAGMNYAPTWDSKPSRETDETLRKLYTRQELRQLVAHYQQYPDG